MNTEILGIGAGICTSVSLLPQLFRIVKQKKAEDLSYFMLAILMTGLAGWTWYGIEKKDLPIILTNSFSIVVNIVLTYFTIRYKEKPTAS